MNKKRKLIRDLTVLLGFLSIGAGLGSHLMGDNNVSNFILLTTVVIQNLEKSLA